MGKVKAEINKSEEIRKLFAANPGATCKEISAKLKAGPGIDASEGLIYSLKPGKKKIKKGKAKATPVFNGVPSVGTAIAIAKVASEKVGSWAALKEIVDALQ